MSAPHRSWKEQEHDAVSVSCPKCGAVAGEPCRSKGGLPHIMKTLHSDRKEAGAQAWRLEWLKTPAGIAAQAAEEERRARLEERRAREEEERAKRTAERQHWSNRKTKSETNHAPEPSSTYLMQWEVQWTSADNEKPAGGEAIAWFPFGVDHRGRVCWRRPRKQNKPSDYDF